MTKVGLRKELKQLYSPSAVTPVQAPSADGMKMAATLHEAQFEALLQHPSLWRGRGIAPATGYPTGHAALDAVLPGGGWPRRGLVEILTGGCCGELSLWMPLLRQFTRMPGARCCTFIAPPFEPFAPAWQAHGVRLDRLLVVRAADPLWAFEQSLLSGACSVSFAWPQAAGMTALRRLALATERGGSLGVLIRPLRAATEHSAAVLRIALRRGAGCMRLQLLKGRGLTPCTVELPLP